MLDIKWIKENAAYAKERLATRQKNYDQEIDRLLELDVERRALIADTDNAIGIGGDFVVKREKEGLHANDEGLAMALTDAIGKACKVFGIANNVYRGKFETKYERQNKSDDDSGFSSDYASDAQVKAIYALAKKGNIAVGNIVKRYEVAKPEEMSKAQASDAIRILKKQVGE